MTAGFASWRLPVALALILALLAASPGLAGQAMESRSGGSPALSGIYQLADDRLAFHLLDSHLTREADKTRWTQDAGGVIGCILGGLLLGGAATLAIWGDDLGLDSGQSGTAALVMGACGLAGTGTGIGLLASPVPDLKAPWQAVYDANDPGLQESLALAALESVSRQAFEERLSGGITLLALPLVLVGVRIGSNLGTGKTWHAGLDTDVLLSLPPVLSGLGLLLEPQDAEGLLAEYHRRRRQQKALQEQTATVAPGTDEDLYWGNGTDNPP